MLEETWERAFKSAIKLWFRERHVAEIQVCTLGLDTSGRREVTGSRRGLARSMPKHFGSRGPRGSRLATIATDRIFWARIFGLTGKSKRNLIDALKTSSCE